MITYLLKMMLCSGLLLLVYRLLLQPEKMYRFNRFYLLLAVVLPFVAPLITFNIGKVVQPVTALVPAVANEVEVFFTTEAAPALPETVDYWPIVLVSIYALITCLLLSRFVFNFFTLLRAARRHRQQDYQGATLVLTEDEAMPHSFFRYIFLHRPSFTDGAVAPAILQHELAHVQQRHTIDIVLMELLVAVAWINPFLLLYRRMVKLNHEFLADEAVIHRTHDAVSYQYLLLNTLSKGYQAALSSSFNYLITKKRLVMMNKTTNRIGALARQVALLPVLAGTIFLFSTHAYAQEPVKAREPVKFTPPAKATPPQDAKKPVKATPARANFAASVPVGPGATAEDLAYYDEVVRRTVKVSTLKDGRERIDMDMNDVDTKKMAAIYKQMNAEQRGQRNESAGVNYVQLSKPLPKFSPTDAQLEKWTNDPAKYGVWINEKQVPNSELKKYKASDFFHHFESKLAKNAVNYGKHYVQVDLYKKPYAQPRITSMQIVH